MKRIGNLFYLIEFIEQLIEMMSIVWEHYLGAEVQRALVHEKGVWSYCCCTRERGVGGKIL